MLINFFLLIYCVFSGDLLIFENKMATEIEDEDGPNLF